MEGGEVPWGLNRNHTHNHTPQWHHCRNPEFGRAFWADLEVYMLVLESSDSWALESC